MKKFLVFGLLLILAAGGALVGYPKYKEWRQRHYLALARSYFEKQDYRNAGLSARKTLDTNPRNVSASRVMAEIADKFRSSLAIAWRQRVVELEPGVAQNLLDLATSAMLQGKHDQADRALRQVDPAAQNSAAYHQLGAMVAVAQKNIGKAEWHYAQALKIEPENKLLQFNRAVLLLQAKDAKAVETARTALEQLARDPALRKDALRHLVLTGLKSKEFAPAHRFSQELQADSTSNFDDRILHLSVLKEEGSLELARYLSSLEEEATKAPADLFALASWLGANQMADEIFRWLGALPEEVRSKPPSAIALADGHIARKDWAGLQTLLTGSNWDEADYLRLAYLARANREQDLSAAARAEWGAAVKAAGTQLGPLSTLVQITAAWKWDKEREELLWAIIPRHPSERWMFESLNQLYTASGNTRGLQKLYAALLDLDPEDVAAKNNFASLALLLNLQTNRAHQLAREAFTRHPQIDAFVSTYAYSLHLQGKTAEALKLLEGLNPDQLAEPGIAIYYGLILMASEQPDQAAKYLALAGSGRLLPEEAALLTAIRKDP